MGPYKQYSQPLCLPQKNAIWNLRRRKNKECRRLARSVDDQKVSFYRVDRYIVEDPISLFANTSSSGGTTLPVSCCNQFVSTATFSDRHHTIDSLSLFHRLSRFGRVVFGYFASATADEKECSCSQVCCQYVWDLTESHT